MTVTNVLNRWRWNTERGKRMFNEEKEKVDTTDAFTGDGNHSSKTWLKSEWNTYLTTFCIKNETVFSYISIHSYLKTGANILRVGIYLEDVYILFHGHKYVAIWHASNSNNQNHVFLWNIIKAYNQQLAFYQWSSYK